MDVFLVRCGHAIHMQCVLDAGKQVLLSEQQLVDCSWDFGENSACDGGMYDAAMDYIITKAGGAVTEASYEYLGADGFCKTNLSADAVAFKVISFRKWQIRDDLVASSRLATAFDGMVHLIIASAIRCELYTADDISSFNQICF